MCYACGGEALAEHRLYDTIRQFPHRALTDLLAGRFIENELRYNPEEIDYDGNDYEALEDFIVTLESTGLKGHFLLPEEVDLAEYEMELKHAIMQQEADTYRKIRENMAEEDWKEWAKVIGGAAAVGGEVMHSILEGRLPPLDDPYIAGYLEGMLVSSGAISFLHGWWFKLHPKYGPEDVPGGLKTILKERRLPPSGKYKRAQRDAVDRVYVREPQGIDISDIERQLEEDGLHVLQDFNLDDNELAIIASAVKSNLEDYQIVEIGMKPRDLNGEDNGADVIAGLLDAVPAEDQDSGRPPATA